MKGQTMKTAAQRKADERTRYKTEGRASVTCWVYPEDRDELKRYAQALTEIRAAQKKAEKPYRPPNPWPTGATPIGGRIFKDQTFGNEYPIDAPDLMPTGSIESVDLSTTTQGLATQHRAR